MSSARPSKFAPAALTEPGRVRLYSTAELLRLPPPKWLITDILPRGSFIGLYGEPSSGKTFVAIDWALSVACGGHWQNHDAGPGQYVLYISAEGGTGIGKRVNAWLTDRCVRPADVRMAWMIEPLPLYHDSTEVDTLIARIEDEVEIEPTLIVIDTLARCLDGDENTQEDMGRFVKGVDRLRTRWKSTVLAIHHTNVSGERERGSTAFRGATDTMISVQGVHVKGGRGLTTIHLTCNKQRDAPDFDRMKLKVIPVESADSCVVALPAAVSTGGRPSLQALRQDHVLTTLCTRGPLTTSVLKVACELPKTAFFEALTELELTGCIQKTSGEMWEVVR